MFHETFVQVVRVGLASTFSFRRRRDVGQFPGALSEDGAVALAHGPEVGLVQGFGCALVDLVADLAEQALHQSRGSLDDKGQFAQVVL